MDVLKKLSIRNLKLNKKRTISTIIGIILSTALICGVFTLVSSFRETLVQNAINEYGYYHIKLSDLKDEDIETIENNRDIGKVVKVNEMGYAKLDGSENEYKPYVNILSLNEDSFNQLKFKLLEGSFPENSNEILISKHIIDNGKVNLKVGDTITLDAGSRMDLEGNILNSSEPYNISGENISNQKEYTFKIVGKIDRPNYNFENYDDPGYTVITTGLSSESKDVYLTLSNPKEYKTTIPELLGAKDYDEIESRIYEYNENLKALKYEYELNDELLRWEVFAVSDTNISMLYSVSAVVSAIIVFTSVFCIRNSFSISVMEKIKMYGMLASVGATKKQIRKNVIFEALLLGVIGIPIGIISGFFAIWVLLKIVNSLIGEYLLVYVDGILFHVSIISVIISILLGIITIYLSAISSARKASKVSPIEQLRNSKEIKLNSKKLKSPKIIQKIFKTGGVLAYKNLKRSKKKYRTTVISIAVSVAIFIAMNAMINNAFGYASNYYKDYDYNVKLYLNDNKDNKDTLKKIKNLDSVDTVFTLYSCKDYLKISDLSKVNLKDVTIVQGSYYDSETKKYVETEDSYVQLIIQGLDTESFKKYAKKAGLKYEDVKDKGILQDNYSYYNSDTKTQKTERIYNYKKNDFIKGKYDGKSCQIQIGGITDKPVYGLEESYFSGGVLIVDYSKYTDLEWTSVVITLQSNNSKKTIEEIEKIDPDSYAYNIEEQVREQRAMILVIKIFLYGFIGVITLIGVTNIFNTVTSNIELRSKEFAMLKSIGMTKKEFNRMVNLETLFYGTKSLIYGIILGLIGTLAIYKAFSIGFDLGVFIPIKAIIISMIFVYILIFIIMRYSVKKVNKQNIIETIRKDNI